MNYKFPEIRTIDDVLPHIEGREEFIVAEREGYTVINYVVAMADTFDMTGPDDLGGAMRRECRGLIFYKDGRLMSRPFHKFFNVNERDETQMNKIDLSQPHVIMEKLDGSMIRPVVVDGHIRLGTKMGVTEVAMNAEAWLVAQPDYEQKLMFLETMIADNKTPIFEWTSRKNQIVIDYAGDDLILTAIRDNFTGEYVLFNRHVPFNVVPTYGSVEGNLADYIDRQRGKEGREGDIIRFSDGHMLKIKNDWYVRIHKTIERVEFDRNIVDLIINENIDDVIPMLPTVQVDRIRDFEKRFWAAFRQTEYAIQCCYDDASLEFGTDRKSIALEFVPRQENKAYAQFIFRMLDRKDVRVLLLEHIEKNISSNTKWDKCAEWLGM